MIFSKTCIKISNICCFISKYYFKNSSQIKVYINAVLNYNKQMQGNFIIWLDILIDFVCLFLFLKLIYIYTHTMRYISKCIFFKFHFSLKRVIPYKENSISYD